MTAGFEADKQRRVTKYISDIADGEAVDVKAGGNITDGNGLKPAGSRVGDAAVRRWNAPRIWLGEVVSGVDLIAFKVKSDWGVVEEYSHDVGVDPVARGRCQQLDLLRVCAPAGLLWTNKSSVANMKDRVNSVASNNRTLTVKRATF